MNDQGGGHPPPRPEFFESCGCLNDYDTDDRHPLGGPLKELTCRVIRLVTSEILNMPHPRTIYADAVTTSNWQLDMRTILLFTKQLARRQVHLSSGSNLLLVDTRDGLRALDVKAS